MSIVLGVRTADVCIQSSQIVIMQQTQVCVYRGWCCNIRSLSNEIEVHYVGTSDDMADPFTKEVSGVIIRKLFKNSLKTGKIKRGTEIS